MAAKRPWVRSSRARTKRAERSAPVAGMLTAAQHYLLQAGTLQKALISRNRYQAYSLERAPRACRRRAKGGRESGKEACHAA